MKHIITYGFIIIVFSVITFLNVSLSRATQIESFLTQVKGKVQESTSDKLFITMLSTTTNPEETFLLENPLYDKTHDTFSLVSEVTLYVYTEGLDPKPYLIVSVNDIAFKSSMNEVNKDTQVVATFVFEEPTLSGNKEIQLFFSHLYDTTDQLFSIYIDELYLGSSFNLVSIQIVLTQGDALFDVATIKLNENPNIESTIKDVRALNDIQTLQSRFDIYKSSELLGVYESYVKFPLKNVIIEILIFLFIYVGVTYLKSRRQQ